MNRHDRRRANRVLKCTSGHQAADCDGSCHARPDLAAFAFDEERALWQADSQLRLAFAAFAMIAPEIDDETDETACGVLLLLALAAAHTRALTALRWRLLAAFLTFAYRRAALARLALEARSRRRAMQPGLLACLDHMTAAPRTGPPAGRAVACLASGGALA